MFAKSTWDPSWMHCDTWSFKTKAQWPKSCEYNYEYEL